MLGSAYPQHENKGLTNNNYTVWECN